MPSLGRQPCYYALNAMAIDECLPRRGHSHSFRPIDYQRLDSVDEFSSSKRLDRSKPSSKVPVSKELRLERLVVGHINDRERKPKEHEFLCGAPARGKSDIATRDQIRHVVDFVEDSN